ncbi:FliM/FliN family flagellar motor C-terminal domain-containing protein [Jannaschia sp. W003]|uniref:FliM/FliN family flagellar motor C-terminal domain-containing protein n=1 Tax=Jannaschia sp. W003 TaxID=2867012 RepID=UPI0021A3EB24|nr:FliM/FliN family flagellar motor C-terminal domain-containing protein [Jannaschia sp. W003]UWQ21819.1 FliM/FliN family flagellar motor C-terminal domain-containing protein [Jannaschia sp. W003]
MTDAPLAETAERGPFARVPVEVTVSVGRAYPTVAELLRLAPDAVMTLDQAATDPVELYAGDRLIARGTLEEAVGEGAGRLAVRLTEIADLNGTL